MDGKAGQGYRRVQEGEGGYARVHEGTRGYIRVKESKAW